MTDSANPPVVVTLSDPLARLLAPLAGSLLAVLAPGGDVRCCAQGIVLAGPVEDADARVAVAMAIRHFAEELHFPVSTPDPVALRLDEHPGAANGSAPRVLSVLVCEGTASPDPQARLDLVERLIRTALSRSIGAPLCERPVLARFVAHGYRYVAVLVVVDRGQYLRQCDSSAFLEALREAVFEEFFTPCPRGVAAVLDADLPVAVTGVSTATLPLLGASRDNVTAYAAHLERMLGQSAHFRFVAQCEFAPVDGGRLAPPSADGVPDLHLCCVEDRHYDCTRAALLAQLVDHSLAHLAAHNGTDGSLHCVDAWSTAHTPGLDRYLVPLCDEESLYVFTAYVDEAAAAGHSTMDPDLVLSETQRCISIVLDGVPSARWWCPQLMRLQAIARVSIATDPRTGRRFYVACGVLDSAEACRWWSDSEVVRRALADQIRVEQKDFGYLAH